jgi:hypothetical protein
MPAKRIIDLRKQRDLTAQAFAAALGCNVSYVRNFVDTGDIAKNHPLIPKIAAALKLSESDVRVLCRRPDMTEMQLGQSLARLGKPHPTRRGKGPKRKPLTWVQRRKAARVAQAGTSVVHVPKAKAPVVHAGDGKLSKRAYNALRLMDKDTRQCARSLAMATTLAAIKGKKYLDVAIPTLGMAAILTDWFRLKGIDEPVVPAVDYDAVFG